MASFPGEYFRGDFVPSRCFAQRGAQHHSALFQKNFIPSRASRSTALSTAYPGAQQILDGLK